MTKSSSQTTGQVPEAMYDEGGTEKAFDFFESEGEFIRLAAVASRSNCVTNARKLTSVGIEMRPVATGVGDPPRKMRAVPQAEWVSA